MNAWRSFARGYGPVLVAATILWSLPVSLPAARGQDGAPPPQARTPDDEQSIAEMFEQRMQMRTTLEFVDTPFVDVIDVLTVNSELRFSLDEKALTDAGVGTDSTISLHVRDLRLESAMTLLLKQLGLDWDYRNETVMITSRDQAAVTLSVRVHPVGDLLRRIGGEPETLLQAVRLVAPDAWDEMGGPAHVSLVDGSLVVSAPRQVHADLARLVGDLRRLYGLHAPPPVNRDREQEALEALEMTVELEFVDTPLVDIRDVLSDKFKIQIQLDERSLTDAGVGSDTMVTRTAKGITLRSFLNSLLADMDLTFAIENEVITLMSIEDNEARMGLRLHVLGALTNDDQRLQRLQSAIQNCIAPYSWEDAGGAGAMRVMPSLLLVRQTPQRQDQIATLLERLRIGGGDPVEMADQNPPASSDSYRRVVYVIHGLSPAEVAKAITFTIAPDSWQAGQGAIFAIGAQPMVDVAVSRTSKAGDPASPEGDQTSSQDSRPLVVASQESSGGRLIVIQRPDVHAEIAALLRELNPAYGNVQPPGSGGGGFGGGGGGGFFRRK